MFILLCCAAGMSTSLLVTKMEQAAKQKGIEVKILAVSEDSVSDYIDQIDVLLLGPQVRYKLNYFQKEYADKNVAIDLISPTDYGLFNGEKVLNQALNLVK